MGAQVLFPRISKFGEELTLILIRLRVEPDLIRGIPIVLPVNREFWIESNIRINTRNELVTRYSSGFEWANRRWGVLKAEDEVFGEAIAVVEEDPYADHPFDFQDLSIVGNR